MPPFIHGVQTNFVSQAIENFNSPQTATIALVGTAPKGATNELVTITNARSGRDTFGLEIEGFTIPYALDHIFKQGGAKVIVVNIFDPTLHGVPVVNEPVAVADGQASLANEPFTEVELRATVGGDPLTLNQDYTIDGYGVIRVLDGVIIPDGENILASYSFYDPELVTDAQVIGEIGEIKTGVELLDNATATLGLTPKIIIVPELGQTDVTTAKMAEKAAKFGAIYLVDAPEGSTVETVVRGRGPLGGIPGFRTDDKNLYPLFPYVQVRDSRSRLVNRPLSVFAAGIFSRVDARPGIEGGVAKGPSNEVITGALGTSVTISSAYSDPFTDTNALNEVGVATVFDGGSRGKLLWGLRNASSVPNVPNTASDVFISVQRVKHMVAAAIQLSTSKYLGLPGTRGLIDTITEAGSAYLRGLVTEGTLLGGTMVFDQTTTQAEISQGIYKFLVDIQPPTSVESLVFSITLNPEYFNTLTV